MRSPGVELGGEQVTRVQVVGWDHEKARVATRHEHVVEPVPVHSEVRESPAVDIAAHDVGLESHDAFEQVLGGERTCFGPEALDPLRRVLGLRCIGLRLTTLTTPVAHYGRRGRTLNDEPRPQVSNPSSSRN